MPELPEVETIVRSLAPRLTGRHIVSAEILKQRIVRYSKHDVPGAVTGQRVREVTRHGKFILIGLERGFLTIHLGMTGQLRFDSPITPHTRAIFQLDGAALVYDDPRMFGSIEYSEATDRTDRLGPDALNSVLSPELLRRKAPIKAVLLNQSIFAGVGNIYADESLFRAGIHPRRRADRIAAPRASRLIQVVQEVLAEAVEHRGSSVSDYVDTEGRKGDFQLRHRVYGRKGLPCLVCGTPLRKIVVAQRGTHYCPVCQR
ncbi:MAG: bifunctional DNA-formamidopyrimidine glycosylase/DNA-(apurinic or apyrimidinic site) lyase [Bryobacteraceae bacterium]|nr:bifunctional DNA-formamidopyrimidine glycosylase/DNA-(apurinic or apyrimidinic site) lyase [Bryobacteraceae bacterium]